MQEDLEKSYIIKSERKSIFKEAVELYNHGYYYGCVSLLMTQIIGIVSDIESYLSQNGKSYAKYNEQLLSDRYHISKTNEKGRVIATLLEGKDLNDKQGEYWYLIGYFRNKIFSNKLEECDLKKHANRHMIFHGEQCSFGSKEQALKLILCIDSLYWISEVICDNITYD